MLKKCIELITEQQHAVGMKGPVYWCGEQLKDICKETAGAAELVVIDIVQPGMRLSDCENKIREHFKDNRTSPDDGPTAADKVIREFYGIGEQPATPAPASPADINLLDLI